MNTRDLQERELPEFETFQTAVRSFNEAMAVHPGPRKMLDIMQNVASTYVDWLLAYEHGNAAAGRPFNGRNHAALLRKEGISAEKLDTIVQLVLNEVVRRSVETSLPEATPVDAARTAVSDAIDYVI